MFIKIEDKEIRERIQELVRQVLKDNITMKWVRDVVNDEVRKMIRLYQLELKAVAKREKKD